MNSIAADNDLEEFALTAVDLDDRTILDPLIPTQRAFRRMSAPSNAPVKISSRSAR